MGGVGGKCVGGFFQPIFFAGTFFADAGFGFGLAGQGPGRFCKAG
jgi:hypothetical protein